MYEVELPGHATPAELPSYAPHQLAGALAGLWAKQGEVRAPKRARQARAGGAHEPLLALKYCYKPPIGEQLRWACSSLSPGVVARAGSWARRFAVLA